jgi:hypothetical protein
MVADRQGGGHKDKGRVVHFTLISATHGCFGSRTAVRPAESHGRCTFNCGSSERPSVRTAWTRSSAHSAAVFGNLNDVPHYMPRDPAHVIEFPARRVKSGNAMVAVETDW